MVNRNKIKGSAFERDVADYLVANGFPEADRRYGAGAQFDKGDIIGVPKFALECKNQAKIMLSEFLAEALIEAKHANKKYGAAVIKRRGKGVADSYVVMSLSQFVELLKEKL
jgi:Holliday junction resolvase